jgi:5-methylcytosine-specific restriction protein A
VPSVMPHACNHPGCPAITTERYCPAHAVLHRRQYDRARGSASKRGYGASWTKRREAFLRANPTCIKCGRKSTVCDHIIPKNDGGADDESNWQPLCRECHSRKTVQRDGGFGRPRAR